MYKVIVTCEHGGNKVPIHFKSLFGASKKVLDSHRGWDIGALDIARYIAPHVADAFFYATATRLLIDLNRSLHHPHLFSEFTKNWTPTLKQMLIDQIYKPYREPIKAQIEKWIAQEKQVLHFSIHSFVPTLNGIKRMGDIGLLYDPGRYREKDLCLRFKQSLEEGSSLTVRKNYPYRGISDGLVSELRKSLDLNAYVGIEIEINQKHLYSPEGKRLIKKVLLLALQEACEEARSLPLISKQLRSSRMQRSCVILRESGGYKDV